MIYNLQLHVIDLEQFNKQVVEQMVVEDFKNQIKHLEYTGI